MADKPPVIDKLPAGDKAGFDVIPIGSRIDDRFIG